MSQVPPHPQSFEQINDPVGQRVTVGLAKISMALRQQAWQQGHARDLTPTQGEALSQLQRTPGLTLGEVAERLGVRPSTASEAVTALEAKGWVERHRDPADRRRLHLRLTPEGRNLAQDVDRWPQFLADVVEELDEEEKGQLMRLLQRMIRTLQRRGEIPVARMCAGCRYFRPRVHDDRRRPHHCAYVDLPFGDQDLRVDCAEHEPATGAEAEARWRRFSQPPSRTLEDQASSVSDP
jgi:DNA-binding MarR family transcriptional regulator